MDMRKTNPFHRRPLPLEMISRFVSRFVGIALIAGVLSACVTKSVNDVALGDAGQAFKVKFGTVLAVKQVNIRSNPEIGAGAGLLVGSAAGAGYGRTETAALEGAIAGALVGAVAQHSYETGNGYEYTIAFADGSTEVIDQAQAAEDPVFKPGAAVMVQYGATRNRVLPADHLPTNVAMPKSVRVAGAPKPTRHLGVTSCQKMPSGAGERKTCTEE